MSARVDAVASRVQSAVTTKRVTSSMNGVVKAMDSAMKVRVYNARALKKILRRFYPWQSMNLEKISSLMDKFEKEFEDLDVQTSVMEGAMSQTTATNVPQVSLHFLGLGLCQVFNSDLFFRMLSRV